MRAIWLTNEISKQISSWPKPHAGHPLSSYNWFLFCQTQGARIKKTKQKTIAKYLRQSTETQHLNLNNSIEFMDGQGIITAVMKKGRFPSF